MKKTITCISIIVEVVISLVLDKMYNCKINNVSLFIIVGIPMVLMTLIISIGLDCFYLKKKKTDMKTRIDYLESRLSDVSTLGVNPYEDKGTRLLFMSLCQNYTEPLRITLLKESAFTHHNMISAILLANIYRSGIKQDDKFLITPDLEKAYEVYNKVEKNDQLGISAWELGWIYENNLIPLTQKMTETDRKNIAYKYYEVSAEKGFPKAYNSLGKFYYNGWGGLDYNYHKAEKYYSKAAELDDIYAIMNYGLLSMKKYSIQKEEKDLIEAERYFKKAIQYDNTEGYLQLGIIYDIKISKNPKYVYESKKYYITAIKMVENQYSADAYYRLGKLINRFEELENDDEILKMLGKMKLKRASIECFNRALEIFSKAEQKNYRLDGDYKKDYEELKKHFKAIL